MSAGLLNLAAATNSPDRMAEIGEASNRMRAAQGRWREQLASGEKTLFDVLRQRPSCLHTRPLLDLLTWPQQMGRNRVAGLNELAINDGVNLAFTLGDASPDTLRWLEIHLKEGAWRKSYRDERPRWRHIARSLAAAIERHERDVRDDDAPVDAFAQADDKLYAARERIMGRAA